MISKFYAVMSFFRLTRVPNLIMIGLTQYITAIFLVQGKSEWLRVITDIKFLLLVASTSMIAGAGYIINDYYDTKIDYVNRPKKVIVGRLISRRYVLASYFTLNGFAVLIGLFLSLKIAAIHILSSLLLWLHSNQFKRLPLLGNVIIGALSGSSLLIVAIFYNNLGGLVYAYAFFAFVINVIREIVKDLEAIKGEEKFGSYALPSALGIRGTKMLIYAVIMFSFIALSLFLYNIDNGVAVTYFLILIPVFVYFIYLLVKADTQRSFALLGDFANFIMLTGIISIALF